MAVKAVTDENLNLSNTSGCAEHFRWQAEIILSFWIFTDLFGSMTEGNFFGLSVSCPQGVPIL